MYNQPPTALTVGTRFGPYEIVAHIGAGGMGQVYRARDTTLHRDVALKILSDAFAHDPDRLARFTREAQTLASLNHPNIAHIHGLEESDGVRALVMELVEGEDLSQRIAHGAIPLDEALPIARQIADALEAAHEQNIVHRDLKPANIKVREAGTVKVLDFGLAKALEPAGVAADVANSPTITSPAMTQAGMILGTAAYMSPEQARGRTVDKRADIWAFGVVVFEMLTGGRAFVGDDTSITLAAVMMKEPEWRALPASTPLGLRRLLTRCLKKDPKARMRDIGEARLQIEELLSGAPESAGVPAIPHARSIWRHVLPWASTGALAAGLAAVLLVWAPWRSVPAAVPLRVSAELGADASLVIAFIPTTPTGSAAAISRDGTQLAFVAQPRGGGAPLLYIRRLDQLTATPLRGTENAAGPFFSPDGQWLGFFSDGWLKKIAVTGGAPARLAEVTNARGGSWAEDETIIFAPNSTGGLKRVSAAGGRADQLTTPAPGEGTHRWPQVLPGSRAVLYTVSPTTGVFSNAWLAVQPLLTSTPKIVHRGGAYGRYLPSGLGSPTRAEREGGHLTWVSDGTLFAAPFDLDTLAVRGPAVPVLPLVVSGLTGNAQMDVSRNGTLLYLAGAEYTSAAPLDWLTRDGKTTPLMATAAPWGGVQIARDGRLAFFRTDVAYQDVWTYDPARVALTPLTLGAGVNRTPVWTPNGERLVYTSSRSGDGLNLWWQRVDRRGDATRLTKSPNTQYAGSWDPSGRVLAFSETRPQTTNADLLTLRVVGDEASGWKAEIPREFLATAAVEQQPRFSPDGRWLAYESNESGRFEIYVQPFPGPGARSTISTDGGMDAVWSRAPGRHELLFLAPDGRIMVVTYTAAGDVFQPGKPRVWSATPVLRRPFVGTSFDLHPDGERVAMAPVTEATAGPTHVTLWFNFFDELRRLSPVK